MCINGCLQFVRSSVLVNGSPTEEFEMSKGVMQGDPLSSFLFIVAMEGLNIVMKTACEKDIFHGVKVSHTENIISHLFYADDALFVREWSRDNIKNLSRILRCFHVASDLKVNFNKSTAFGVGADMQEVS